MADPELPGEEMQSGPAVLRSGQLAAAAAVHVETLRYYERRGLIPGPDRSPGGHRLYPVETVTTLRVIKAAQRLGFTLDEVAELFDLVGPRHQRRPSRRSRRADGLQQQARRKLTEVEERLADLTTIRDALRAAIDAGCNDLIACAHNDCCPIPFVDLTPRPAISPTPCDGGQSDH